MSAAAPSARPRVQVGLALPVLAGIGVLLLRLRILDTSGATRIALLTAVFAAILVASLLVPVAPGVARARPWIVTVIGLAGVGVGGARRRATDRGAAGRVGAPARRPRRRGRGGAVPPGRLRMARTLRAAVVVVGSALLFAAVHVPLYGVAALPVDLGAGLLLSWQRWASGTWTVPAAHARRGQRAGGGAAMKEARGARVCLAMVGAGCTGIGRRERRSGSVPCIRSRARRARAASTSTAASCWRPTS